MKARNWIGFGVGVALSFAALQIPLSKAQAPPNPVPIKPDVPYVPTPESVVMAMLKLANVSRNDVVYDLGSGDGRLVITAAQKFGAKRGVGVEINPGLVNRSIENAKQAGVSDRVQFFQQDLFKANFSEASVVTLYLLPRINLQLRPKLLSELKPGSRVVSHAFGMGDWKPDRTETIDDSGRPRLTYLWIIPANVSGTWSGTIRAKSGALQPYSVQVTQSFQNVRATVNVNGQTISLPNVKLTGDRLTLEYGQQFNNQPLQVRVNAQAIGDTLQGTADIQTGSTPETYTINAKRTSATQGS